MGSSVRFSWGPTVDGTGLRLRSCIITVAYLIVAVLGFALPTTTAEAATDDVGYIGPSTSGAGGASTGEKPESKLWWNDGRWWASMFDSTSRTWHIFYLDRSASPKKWVNTGTVIDPRPNSRADTLWDGATCTCVMSSPVATPQLPAVRLRAFIDLAMTTRQSATPWTAAFLRRLTITRAKL